ncbi:hypothetical protein HOS59_gp53 [Streptomyces phage Rowa]|uniref:Uncharacterized protein n=1 Tax=Streptomyces phage Rowa TaxID=2059883 RepID=A0A2H5BLX7_9CAUD|nr:hypothetical protein HOS59_gp53 [Streptomyces phage Rowa]AUG87317.1 hypothetical protein SEA_ROWA_53 [Streptomyces phage Rowa]
MADGIKLDIIHVEGVKEYADRSIDITAVDRVRGPIVIRMQETEARWLWASFADMVPQWRTADDED